MDQVFDSAAILRLGNALVKIASKAPAGLVRNTPFMSLCFGVLGRLANVPGTVRKTMLMNQKVAGLLGYHDTQYNTPGLDWVDRGKHRVPILIATYEQQLQYYAERRPVQVLPEILAQIRFAFEGGNLPPTKLPDDALVEWMRAHLLHSPVHWYVTQRDNGISMDFGTLVDAVTHESVDCKYNIRDIEIDDDNTVRVNHKTHSQAVPRLTLPPEAEHHEALQHVAFLTNTLIQQGNSVSYHNWVHFYFNDIVLYNVQCGVDRGHWIRHLMDPHMRYQAVLNNAGMFSRVPNDIQSTEVYDDVLFGGNLSSWTLDTFQKNIMDKTLGYYARAEHSAACQETLPLMFNLNRIKDHPNGATEQFAMDVEAEIHAFVGDVIDACATEEDEYLMALIVENTLKFLHPDCLDGIPEDEDTIRGRFTRVVSRYILLAGVLHCFEHYNIYFWAAPLSLPQRIRAFYDVNRSFEDYAYAIDRSNGYFGHRMFTRYVPNADNQHNWSSVTYAFTNATAKARSEQFAEAVRGHLARHDDTVLRPAREILERNGIEVPAHCTMSPELIGCSICM